MVRIASPFAGKAGAKAITFPCHRWAGSAALVTVALALLAFVLAVLWRYVLAPSKDAPSPPPNPTTIQIFMASSPTVPPDSRR